MSRIGRMPVPIPADVKVNLDAVRIEVTGPKGTQSLVFHEDMNVEIKDNEVHVTRPTDERLHRSLHGLTRSLIANIIEGVTKGFERVLEINGVGYKAAVQGNNIEVDVGFAHPKNYKFPSGIDVEVKGNKVFVRGIDKKIVGEVASKIRAFRPPEPYNGKGIKYEEEVIRRKTGKTTA